MIHFFTGYLLGLAYVMPIGTQNMFVINTALTQKRKRVLITAAIVAFFDISLALACFFGVSAIIKASPILELIMLGVGSLIVIWIGFGIFRSKATLETANVDMTIPKIITTAFVVTWFNPQAILDGAMFIGNYQSGHPGENVSLFVVGVCLASLSWWFGMSTVVNLLHSKITDKILRIINILCGIIIMFYGIKLFYTFIQMLLPYFNK